MVVHLDDLAVSLGTGSRAASEPLPDEVMVEVARTLIGAAGLHSGWGPVIRALARPDRVDGTRPLLLFG